MDHSVNPQKGEDSPVSAMRGHPTGHAAKCIIVMAKLGKKTTKYVLAVIPGDARIAMPRIERIAAAGIIG